MNRRRTSGFTLVEMMAVVVIIGILAAVIAPRFFRQVDFAKNTAAKQDIQKIEQAITLFRLHTGQFPGSLGELTREPDNVRGWNGPYLSKKPKDPWGNEYTYEMPGGNNRDYDIVCLGSDGEEGGEGINADITSWEDEDE